MIIRSQSPDVVVAVGKGDAMKEFDSYRVVLSVASPYFDAMFSTDMREKNNSRIEFPDRTPEEWQIFHNYLAHDPSITIREHVLVLAPMFHEFLMGKQLDECDEILATKVAYLSRKEVSPGTPRPRIPRCDAWYRCVDKDSTTAKPHLDLKKRKETFAEIVELLEFSCLHDLKKAKREAEDFISNLANALLFGTYDLFDLSAVTKLTQLFLPLKFDDGILVPQGKSEILWWALDQNFCQFEIATLSLDTLNNNKMLPLLVKEHIQRIGHERQMNLQISSITGSMNRVTAAMNAHMGR